MFYKLNEQGQIERTSDVKRDDTWLKTNKEIVRGYDGALYFKGEEPKQDIKVLQEQKLLENNEKCSNYILSVYPFYKQMNIINPLSDYSIEDRTAMNEFIDSQRAKNKEYKKQILDEKIKSKEDLDKIVIKYGE